LIQKCIQNDKKTTITDYNGCISKRNLSNISFIPNSNYGKVMKLICDDENIPVMTICSPNVYRIKKQHVSPNKDDFYKYPVSFYNI
jgi:hypothetical protein